MKKMLSKRNILIILALFMLGGCIYVKDLRSSSISNNEIYNIIETSSNYKLYSFNELEERADIIALVKVKDKLSKENSHIDYIENTPYIKEHYSTREVEVIEYYKNSTNSDKNIRVSEAVAITNNNVKISNEDYEELRKGKKYVLYLYKIQGKNIYSIISANNGKIILEDFHKNKFMDIALETVVKSLNNSSKEKSVLKETNNNLGLDIMVNQINNTIKIDGKEYDYDKYKNE
jgi:hypothetical protein